MPAYLHAFGKYLPERIVTNAELAARIDRAPEWIERASGIVERRWAPPETGVEEMGLRAAQDCLERAGVSAADLGMLIVASGSGARGFPGPAAGLAHLLGLEAVPALDVPIASAGSLFGMALAMQIAPGDAAPAGDILVVATEKMSGITGQDPLDPNTAILFGDGAGAVLISARPGRWRMSDAVLHSDGQFSEKLAWNGAGTLQMEGLTVILQASRKMPAAIREVLERQHIQPQDAAVYLLHQANLNLLKRVAKTLEVPEERVFTNVARYGNTSSASMLIAAAEWAESLGPGAAPGPLVFSAFGAGFHWGAAVAVS